MKVSLVCEIAAGVKRHTTHRRQKHFVDWEKETQLFRYDSLSLADVLMGILSKLRLY